MTGEHSTFVHREAVDAYSTGDLIGAEAVCRSGLQAAPGDHALHHLYGIVRHQRGCSGEGLVAIDRAIALAPAHPAYHSDRGEVLRVLGRPKDAERSYRMALVLDPDYPVALNNLGDLMRTRGQYGEAKALLLKAVKLRPDYQAARNNLAKILVDGGDWEGALVLLKGEGGDAIAHVNRGVARYLLSMLLEAREDFHAALALAPDLAEAHSNLGNVLRDLGDWPGAIASYRRALELKPDFFVAHSNLLFTRLYDPEATGEGMLAEAREWEDRHAARLGQLETVRAADPDKRLRIGYVSPDFRDHAAGFYLEPLVAAHDRRQVEVTCYSDTARSDAVTERMRSAADRWRDVAGVGDGALAEMIRADAIDIVIDCAGHTSGNRLLALAMRPSPVQVTTMFGHGGTTGLAAIDYILTDEVISPEGMESHFSEKVVRLPRVFAPFRVRAEWPEVGTLPGGPAVFGCFAGPARIDGACVELWGQILEAVPGSRILFKNSAYDDERMVAHWRKLFGRVAEGADFEGTPGGWGKNMAAYRRVWVMLDSWPVTGGSSTMIPLWMGVPVVTLAGRHAGQRFGAAIVTGAGMAELAAKDAGDYVAKAVTLVRDRARLAEMRRGLRARVAASPFLDIASVARDTEAAYRAMWRTRCEDHRP